MFCCFKWTHSFFLYHNISVVLFLISVVSIFLSSSVGAYTHLNCPPKIVTDINEQYMHLFSIYTVCVFAFLCCLKWSNFCTCFSVSIAIHLHLFPPSIVSRGGVSLLCCFVRTDRRVFLRLFRSSVVRAIVGCFKTSVRYVCDKRAPGLCLSAWLPICAFDLWPLNSS